MAHCEGGGFQVSRPLNSMLFNSCPPIDLLEGNYSAMTQTNEHQAGTSKPETPQNSSGGKSKAFEMSEEEERELAELMSDEDS